MNAIRPARVKAQVVKKPKEVWRRLREECIVSGGLLWLCWLCRRVRFRC